MWASAILSSIFFASLVLICYPIVRPLQPGRHALHAIAEAWARTILFLNPWWDFTIEGAENIPDKEYPVVIVANHKSQADILAMYLLGLRFRWVAKESLYRIPFLGWGMKAVGYVSIKRSDRASQAKCMEQSALHIREGKSMLFFPEGTRSAKGELLNFKNGAFRLAADCKADVLPVTLLGTERLLPKGSMFPSVAKIRIIVHPRIKSEGKAADELTKQCRETIASALAP